MLRFTIRDLIWLTLLVALGCGWWLNSQRWQRQNAKLQESERSHALSLAKAEKRSTEEQIRTDIIINRLRESSRRFKNLLNEIEKAGYRVSIDGEEIAIQPSRR